MVKFKDFDTDDVFSYYGIDPRFATYQQVREQHQKNARMKHPDAGGTDQAFKEEQAQWEKINSEEKFNSYKSTNFSKIRLAMCNQRNF